MAAPWFSQDEVDVPQDEIQRPTRLRWTPQLHDRFLDAVTQLGGAEKAKPQKIFDLMNTEGVTKLHIKSHLQRYRGHLRKGMAFPPRIHLGGTSNSTLNPVENPDAAAASSQQQETPDLRDANHEEVAHAMARESDEFNSTELSLKLNSAP